MIGNGTRLVTFMDSGADFSEVTYIIDGELLPPLFVISELILQSRTEFTNMWETAYDVTTTTFDCNVNRTNGDPTSELYTINHFLDLDILGILIPDKLALDQTNAASGTGSLGLQAQECGAQYWRSPNFMLVDVSISCFRPASSN